MSKQNEDAIKQLAGVVAQLANIIVSHYPTEVVGAATQGIPAQLNPYDSTLKGSDLVREHFRRGGGILNCLRSDTSDEHAIRHCVVNDVAKIGRDGRFISSAGMPWVYAVACDKAGVVLTASELLG